MPFASLTLKIGYFNQSNNL